MTSLNVLSLKWNLEIWEVPESAQKYKFIVYTEPNGFWGQRFFHSGYNDKWMAKQIAQEIHGKVAYNPA